MVSIWERLSIAHSIFDFEIKPYLCSIQHADSVDTLEDDIEHMHQISARTESRISRMKNKEQQAFVHSKMEAIQCNVHVSEIIKERNIEAKRKMNTVHNAESRAKRLKEERDDRRDKQQALFTKHHILN
jgi:hypothetical protein